MAWLASHWEFLVVIGIALASFASNLASFVAGGLRKAYPDESAMTRRTRFWLGFCDALALNHDKWGKK
jgi:hypothetical protein